MTRVDVTVGNHQLSASYAPASAVSEGSTPGVRIQDYSPGIYEARLIPVK